MKDLSYQELKSLVKRRKKSIGKMYKGGATAKEIATKTKIKYSSSLPMVLSREFGSKNMSQGGVRKNSGRKSGFERCAKCLKDKVNCICRKRKATKKKTAKRKARK